MAHKPPEGPPVAVVATNRKAHHDYAILETVEAGIMLTGPEVKSLRQQQISLSDSFARVEEGRVLLYNMHVNPYAPAHVSGLTAAEPKRPRLLLLHRAQIDRLSGQTAERGCTLVPLKVYFKHGLAKVELALAKGKKHFDKREAIKAKDLRRDIDQALKQRRQ